MTLNVAAKIDTQGGLWGSFQLSSYILASLISLRTIFKFAESSILGLDTFN